MMDHYPRELPSTREMAVLARDLVRGLDPIESPDFTLLAWLQRETDLYRAWEKNKIDEKINVGIQILR